MYMFIFIVISDLLLSNLYEMDMLLITLLRGVFVF
ncbi:hypothetical protein CHRY9293_03438 [Chryseobacterium potabilaquae]|uniref:Uncharacterized protein n=1 Tax=Chryseobacterium potabilaquae TaxID=2675057 RepID=A0A6N4XEK0_9FLAO|nr:hypothetical protein CHRY9293_03438 [Chryseobacterium potabilaquae]